MMSKAGNLYRPIAFAILAFSQVAWPALAEPPDADFWQTGATFDRQMVSPISVRWSGQELRTALQNLSKAQHIAIFLDRRIDPGQTLELTLNDVFLEIGLQEIADSQELGLSLFDEVAYFGPPDAAADLRTLAALALDEVRLVPAGKRAALLDRKALNWPELTKPRDLIAKLAEDAGLKVVGLDRVPHDLWPAGSWPPMRLTDRLSLLAIGFDLQLRVSKDGTAIAFVPRAKPARIVKEYPAGLSVKQQQELVERIPEAEFKLSGGKLFVKARPEDHDMVLYALTGGSMDVNNPNNPNSSPNPKPATGTKVYTLNVQNQPLLSVLKALAKQMNLQLNLNEEALKTAGIDPTERISFEVKESTAEQLWEAALKPAGLSFELKENELMVFPSPDQ